MSDLEKEIAAFEAIQTDLESASLGRWALIHNQELIGTFEAFDSAAGEAVRKFGRGPYLIRQIGAPPVIMPASAMFIFQNG